MQKAIIGKKVGMTQIFDESGKVIPVTVVEAGPCVVTQKKTVETDGYVAVQLGFEDIKESKLTKPEAGHLKKAGVEAKKHLKEFKLDNAADMNVGDVIKADTFAAGDMIDVTGISKGHGYQGVVKRHGAGRTPMTHGGGPVHRHAGSMGASSHQSRIFPGKIGAGQMGNEQVTIENLEVVKVDAELNMIAVRGAIPGPKGGIVYLKDTALAWTLADGTTSTSVTIENADFNDVKLGLYVKGNYHPTARYWTGYSLAPLGSSGTGAGGTGDTRNIVVPVCVLIASACAVAFVLTRKKSRA